MSKSKPQLSQTSYAPNFRHVDRDPDFVAVSPGPIVADGMCSYPGNRAACSTVTVRSQRATFVCLEVIRQHTGIHLMLTGAGARAFADSLYSAADEADAALAAETERHMAPIVSRGGQAE